MENNHSQPVELGDQGERGIVKAKSRESIQASSEGTINDRVDTDLSNGHHIPAGTPHWYKNKYTLIFLAILLVAIGIRFYYFTINANSPIWWDESQYMSVAKTYAGQGFEELAGQRLPGYPLFMSAFFAAGIQNEAIIRFLACFIPSIIMLILLYLVVCRMYPNDKRIALISTAIMAVLWESLFYSNRFQTENFGLIFQLLSILSLYLFINKKNAFWLSLVGAFAIFAFLFRPGQILFLPAIILFLIITNWKEHKAIVISSIAVMILAAVGVMMFVPSLNYLFSSYMIPTNPIAWSSITVFSGLLLPTLNLFFIFGIIISIIILFSNKADTIERRSDILNLLLIITVLFAFMFVIRAPAFEYRWFFPLITGILVFTSKGIVDSCDFMKSVLKNNTGKFFSTALIILVLAVSLAGQINYADPIIKQKATSYNDVKLAGLWMKENSGINDVLFSISKPQTAYYSERNTMSYSLLNNSEQFDEYVVDNNPKWLTVSIYEPHPQWIFEWIMENNETIFPAAAWFADDAQKQTTMVIYGFNNYTSCAVEAETCAV